MKGAIASVEVFVTVRGAPPEATDPPKRLRLSLVVGAPEREASGEGWTCRVALADLFRPESIRGRDSFEALALAVARGRQWIDELLVEGRVLTRDRDGRIPFELP